MKHLALSGLICAAVCGAAQAQRTQPFDTQTLGAAPTAVGVTFQLFTGASGFSWPGPPTYPGGGIVAMTSGTTSSGTRAVRSPAYNGEFSTEGVRLLFAIPQTDIKFTVGAPEDRTDFDRYVYRVRGYNASDVLVYSQDYSTGTTPVECRTQVHATASAANPITRLDFITLIPNASGTLVNAGFSELFDTLEYVADATPPDVNIVHPADDTCVSDSSVVISGWTYEPDGTYVGDTLEYATQPSGPWTLVGSATVPVAPPEDTLYYWNTSALPTGWYYIRITAENLDQLSTIAMRRVFVDGTAPETTLRAPASSQIVGGTTCLDGTVYDICGSTYNAEYRALGGAWSGFAAGTNTINDPLGTWNTTSVPDGTYEVRVTSQDNNANATSLTRTIIVDNSAPVAVISTPMVCEDVTGNVRVTGSATDANMGSWTLQYSSPATGAWVTINSSNNRVVNGTLGFFNTAGLPACAYTLRLVVTDAAYVSCLALGNRSERVLSLNVIQPGVCDDIDFNNDTLFPDTDDIQAFLRVFAGGSCE